VIVTTAEFDRSGFASKFVNNKRRFSGVPGEQNAEQRKRRKGKEVIVKILQSYEGGEMRWSGRKTR